MIEKKCNSLAINKNTKFTIIAGPCAIESEAICFEVAEKCLQLCTKFDFQYVFKASYKKANRTSGKSFRGVGIDAGLKILDKVKKNYNVPILTDVHSVNEVKSVSQVVDILQIPAFLSRQTELIEVTAKTGKMINIKKGQFMSPNEIKLAVEKAYDIGNRNIIVTERGTFFGYNNLVVDFRNFQIIDGFGIPVIYDVTHSLQRPASSEISGGSPEFVLSMSKAAVATGHISGLFVETHPNPKEAKSDALSMIPLSQMEELLGEIKKVLRVTSYELQFTS
ncbi:MAG: 3-deoxy-8-phosphooctulonate synthase [Candidatus Cloacimonetes bacterium]|nr:3-deoxy-8-phosphooctulonate synthase [Candidatus Cloacimonadota bacterium]